MTTLIKPTNVDGIEFYTTPDGESGMSLSGLARFCGVTEAAIRHKLVRMSGSNETAGKWAETIASSGFTVRTKGDASFQNDAVVVKDSVCAQVVEYYAFDARPFDGQETARANYRKFAQAGIRTFIHKMTGYQDSLPSSEADRIRELLDHFDKAKAIWNQRENTKGKGGEHILDGLSQKHDASLPSGKYYTVAEFVTEHFPKVNLTRADTIRLGQITADAYRAIYSTDPTRVNAKPGGKMTVYYEHETHVIRAALMKVIEG